MRALGTKHVGGSIPVGDFGIICYRISVFAHKESPLRQAQKTPLKAMVNRSRKTAPPLQCPDALRSSPLPWETAVSMQVSKNCHSQKETTEIEALPY